MNKKIKKVIAMTLVASSFSLAAPVKYLNVFSTKVYAASTVTADDVKISSDETLYLYSSSSCKNSDKLSSSDTVSEGTTYYTKASESRVKVELSGQDNDKVRIYKDSKAYENGRSIPIDRGTSTSIEIRVYANDYDSYSSNEKKNTANYDRYIVKVKDTSSSHHNSNSDSDSLEGVYLYDIVLDYGQINFSKSTRSYDVNVPKSIDEIKIKAKPELDDYDVMINGTDVDEEDKWAETVSLSQGKNVIKIEVEDNDDNKRTYTLNVYRGTTSSDANTTSNGTIGDIDNTQDSIYLEDLILDDGDTKLNFNHKITSYAIDYKESYDYILIKSEPEKSGHVVRINDDKVDSDNYVSKVSLNKGKNVIKIQVDNSEDYDHDDDDYEKRVYTLTVYRGTSGGTATVNNASNANTNANLKVNQWVDNNGKRQYNDSLGNPLKNMWFLDKNAGYWYYLDADGNIKTGWIQAGSGKWYYLYPSGGAMATNTTINGYKLGSDGAWIK